MFKVSKFPSEMQQKNTNMSPEAESHFDEYEHYNFAYDKHIYRGHSGKQRTKKEAESHTNHFDPNGHSRKIVQKMMNTEANKKTKA